MISITSTGQSIIIILAASIALIKGVDLFIKSSTHIAHKFRISSYTISFFLIAIGTSLPEAMVAVTSAINKTPILSFGDAMGSNITLMTLIVAIPAIFSQGLSTRTALNSKDIYFTGLFSMLPIFLVVDGVLGKLDGVILLVCYVVYARIALKQAEGIERFLEGLDHINLFKQILLFIIATLILLGASELIVESAIGISSQIGLELGLVGLTITALGTSLPEIAFSFGAIKKGEKSQILGDVIGSVVANSTLVLGIASTIHPIDVTSSRIGVPTVFFLVLNILVLLRFARTKEKIDTLEGIFLVILYIVFVSSELYFAH